MFKAKLIALAAAAAGLALLAVLTFSFQALREFRRVGDSCQQGERVRPGRKGFECFKVERQGPWRPPGYAR